MKFRFSLTILSIAALAACSVYQSEGRKFLEKQAFEYAGVEAQPNLKGCAAYSSSQGLTEIHSDARAVVLQSAPLEIRVVPQVDATGKPVQSPYSCDYGFTTPEEQNSKLDPAIELSLRQSPH